MGIEMGNPNRIKLAEAEEELAAKIRSCYDACHVKDFHQSFTTTSMA
jgi:hypothetical protein